MTASFCLECIDRVCLKTKKICEPLDKWLKKNVESYQREQTWGNTDSIEQRQLRKKIGRKLPHIYSEDWEDRSY